MFRSGYFVPPCEWAVSDEEWKREEWVKYLEYEARRTRRMNWAVGVGMASALISIIAVLIVTS